MFTIGSTLAIHLHNPAASNAADLRDAFDITDVDRAGDAICIGRSTRVELALSANGRIATLLTNAEDELSGGLAGTRWEPLIVQDEAGLPPSPTNAWPVLDAMLTEVADTLRPLIAAGSRPAMLTCSDGFELQIDYGRDPNGEYAQISAGEPASGLWTPVASDYDGEALPGNLLDFRLYLSAD